MPKAAIIHGIKGVISRDFLEVFRQVIPGVVTEIECKGVRILAEDVDRYSNKFKEEVTAANSRTTRTDNTGTDFGVPI